MNDFISLPFDVKEIEDNEELQVIPPGDYLAQLDSAVIKPTKKALANKTDEKMLELKFKITKGEFKGRKIFDNLNIVHSSEEAQLIARKKLKSLATLMGVQNELSETRDVLCMVGNDICLNLDINSFRSSNGNLINNNKVTKYKLISDYIEPESNLLPINSLSNNQNEFNDDIPF